jgi:HK97 family phage major capsid protein
MQTIEELREQLDDLNREADGREFTADERKRWNEVNERIDELQVRRDRVRELAGIPGTQEPGTAPPRRRIRDRGPVAADRDKALRTIDEHSDLSSPEAQDRLDRHVRHRDPAGIDSRWIAAVGQPAYATAFGKIVQDPQQAHLRFDPEEQTAVQKVNAVMDEQRTLQESVTTAGGFAVPYQLDPTLLFSSNGQINPIREIARVEPITVKEWRGISTQGTVSSFVPELTEASDDSPVLAQPVVFAHRWQSFIPVSIELLSDWDGAQRELQQVFTDARDRMEATAFLTGDGSDEPVGILPSLSNTERLQITSAMERRFSGPQRLRADPGTAAEVPAQCGVHVEHGVLRQGVSSGRWQQHRAAGSPATGGSAPGEADLRVVHLHRRHRYRYRPGRLRRFPELPDRREARDDGGNRAPCFRHGASPHRCSGLVLLRQNGR